jgi:flagellar hook-basal body complex protein FliE
MIDRINNLPPVPPGSSGATSPTHSPGGATFADVLRGSIEEVARLQQDASSAVQQLATGGTQDVTEVLTAMEKADLAFKTLLAVRGKLMDAYEEIKNIPI